MQLIQKTFQYGEHTVTLETGKIARQADGAVIVRMGDTVVLVTAVVAKKANPAQDFFPLSVHYQERFYAVGKLPGGFMKREGRPSIHDILISRLIDRPLRPLFPEGFTNEIQIIATVMSIDPQISADIPAMLGASASLMIAGVPFMGPMAGARVGYIDGNYVLNPSVNQQNESLLELVVAGSSDAILMVESGAKELSKEVMLEAVMFGHRSMQVAINAINEFAEDAKVLGKSKLDWQPAEPLCDKLIERVVAKAMPLLQEAYSFTQKQERREKVELAKADTVEAICAYYASDAGTNEECKCCKLDELNQDELATKIKTIFEKLEESFMREQVLTTQRRIDGRDTKTVRPINIDLAVLPRVHGSACFTRGETQAVVIATLGTNNDAQMIDNPSGNGSERFMLHYNFPPYCTGEISMAMTPKRREIGHGNLAKRALEAVIPDKSKFPYVIRVVSEITESNGSSSMASVCGGSLALMDAGVPISNPVAGIAMGLIKEGERFAVLTDILGDEDHLGDMDFKVAGTVNGITALQMDIKIAGITEEIMRIALAQAEEGRMHILGLMQEKIQQPRGDVSEYAPRISTLQIHTDKIRDVIGKGGATIKGIIEETGATIDISEQGLVTISAVGNTSGQLAIDRILAIIAEPEIDKVYTGKVMKIAEFGAFVNFMPNRDGLLHISQIAKERVNKVTDYLQEGQIVKVKVVEVDKQGKVKLNMKDVDQS